MRLISFLLASIIPLGVCFTASPLISNGKRSIRSSFNTARPSTDSSPVLTESEQKVYGLLEDIHQSKLTFRIVVIGNGAILESTNELGPVMKLSQSPKSGANLVTFASEDQSFEFHLMTAQISKVGMVEKENPASGRTMRIMRFLDDTGKPICSLILSDDSTEAKEWYQSTIEKHGSEIEI